MRAWMRSALFIVTFVLALTVPGGAGTRVEDNALTASADIVLEGNDIRIQGDVHANGSVAIAGSVRVDGAVEGGQRVALSPGTTVTRALSGAPPATVPSLDFAALRARANRVLSGDQQFSGLTLLPGITYVAGSVVVTGLVFGPGLLVAERSIVIRGSGIVPSAIDLVAGERLVIDGVQIAMRGMLYSAGAVDVTGSGITLTGAIIGRTIAVRGNTVTVTAAPSLVRVLPGVSVGIPAAGGPVAISTPQPGQVFPEPAVMVKGTAPAGARVRIAARHEATGLETVAETVADTRGEFSFVIDLPGPGAYLISVAAFTPGGQAFQTAVIRIVVVREVRTPGEGN